MIVYGNPGDSPEDTLYALDRGDTVAFSDSATELVGLLIDGYSDIPETSEGDEQALEARWSFLHEQIVLPLTALMYSSLSSDTLQKYASEHPNAVEYVQNLADFVDPLRVDANDTSYRSEVMPLVCMATDYLPYTDLPIPTGDIIMVNPYDELTFLQSVGEIARMFPDSGLPRFYVKG